MGTRDGGCVCGEEHLRPQPFTSCADGFGEGLSVLLKRQLVHCQLSWSLFPKLSIAAAHLGETSRMQPWWQLVTWWLCDRSTASIRDSVQSFPLSLWKDTGLWVPFGFSAAMDGSL